MKNTEFVENAKGFLGLGYVYGAKGQMYSKAEAERMAKSGSKSDYYYLITCKRWFGHYVTDCSGLVYLALGKKNMRRADGYMDSCKEKGDVKSIPNIAGLIVWKKGHIGIYLGNGKVIESRGVDYGVVITDLKARPWTKWGKLPEVEYTDSVPVPAPDKYYFILKRNLYWNTKRYGKKTENMKGDDVKGVQARLISLGFSCGSWGADGSYGEATYKAIRKFQDSHGLTVDGITGKKTCEKLKGKWEG